MRLIGLMLSLLLVIANPAGAIPVTTVNGVPLPDFTQMTFGNLPPILEGGSIEITDPALIAQLGYNPSRTWLGGALASQTMMLGDVSEAFGLEQFSLSTISQLGLTSTLNLDQLRLADLKMLATNTVQEIVTSLDYENLPVEAVPLLDDLVDAYFGGTTPAETIGALIQRVPAFGELPLGTANLALYALSGLPGIENAAIGVLQGWAGQFVADIPGLRDVPFARFVLFSSTITGIASLVDIPLSKIEQHRTRTVSGSDIEGFAVPCTRNCLHIELANPLRGKQWIGKTQQVRGGHGALASVNGGKEPTGRLPYGPWGKIVLTDVNEKAGKADFGLYFRACIKGFIDLGCTPYFIGPVPWIPTQEKALTFVGP